MLGADNMDAGKIVRNIKGALSDTRKAKILPDHSPEEQQKIQAMRQSIKFFREELSERFILNTNIANTFKRCFKSQFEKKGFSATRRWCEDIFKKLKKLDDKNRVLRAKYVKPVTTTLRMSRGGETVESKSTGVGSIPKEFKAQNIKEFKKIFYNSTDLDSNFLGTEVKVKPTLSQRAAVNEVKKELNELCDEKNFAPK